MANGHCVTAKLEMMQHILKRANEFKEQQPLMPNDLLQQAAAYDVREEMLEQTAEMKARIIRVRNVH